MKNAIKNLGAILLVEDEQDHAELIMRALKEDGAIINEIFWVKNGQEAIDFISHEGSYNAENAPRPSLILLDVQLPRKNGFEVLQELKSEENYKDIPVVMLTTTSNSSDVEKALKLGANDYIVKPIQFQDFFTKVKGLGHYWALISDSHIIKR
ncbi:MAG: response regulator [SAR324 cluster bacterium]|nr:response regulator [SAR324 cluster bacterium]